jgi:putative DNA methylase
VMRSLVRWESTNNPSALEAARAEIARSNPNGLPKVVDPFGGGGTIPLEAARLGLPTYSGDLNPVAVILQRAMLQFPARFRATPPINPNRKNLDVWSGLRGMAEDVEYYSNLLAKRAREAIGKYYEDIPDLSDTTLTPIAWMWARTVKSPDPSFNGHVPLVKTWILRKKPRKPTVWVQPTVDEETATITYQVLEGGSPPDEGTVARAGGRCIATGAAIPFEYIREEARAGRMGSHLLAVVAEGPQGRVYLDPPDEPADVPPSDGPSGSIFDWPGRLNVVRYGLTEWRDLFLPRQLLALTTFSDLLAEVAEEARADAVRAGLANDDVRFRDGGHGAAAYVDALRTCLAFVIDRCAGRWTSLTLWHNGRETIEHVFRRQSIPMSWDFPEANPFSNSSGSWSGQVEWVTKYLEVQSLEHEVDVAQRDAAARLEEVGTAVLCTDPPYYDNVPYADISDYYYVWLRRNLNDVWPDECSTLLTPKAEELIANRYRAGSKQAAIEHFEQGMHRVLATAAAQASDAAPATIFYAFKASEDSSDGVVSTGWETFLSGLINSGWAISATWPLRTELITGVKGKLGLLASSIVLACRPRQTSAALATRGEFIGALRDELAPAIRLLQVENIAPVDLAQSAMGPGIAIFSRFAKVVEADGSAMTVRAALGLINEVLSEVLSGEESEFDAETRFALTWFEQFGHNPGPFGDADLLARAKNTTVGGVADAGLVVNRDAKVRLVERGDLPEAWDPTRDNRLTVWEAAQHLIRQLESSESSAAALLTRLGPGIGDRARQLAYLLYGVSERKRWADEASAYNMLVTAWPEISRLAARASSAEDEPEALF